MDRLGIIRKVKDKLAANRINWIKPKFVKELASYYEKPETMQALREKGLLFTSDMELVNFLVKGKLTSVKDEELKEKGKNITIDPEDFDEKVVTNQNLSPSYKHLEKSLFEKDLNIEAPILIKFSDGTYWGFSGNRRANLARKNKLSILYWVIDQKKILKDKEDKEKRLQKEEEKYPSGGY